MDDVDRAAARLDRAAQCASFMVAVAVVTFLVLAISACVLVALWMSWLDEMGTPV